MAVDPRAVPLKDYIANVMDILRESPDMAEIHIGRAKPMRFAEASGDYEAVDAERNSSTPHE